ncbi:MAG: hypothetical protein RRA15_02850 [bacterium]|nr:hypothetical protein [bacterium]MDT8365413.1 hypothetical protein [bacterium]
MEKMIIDIDDSSSVKNFVAQMTEGWFDPERIYFDLKANGNTDSLDFWCGNPTHLLSAVSASLHQTAEEFLILWNQKCIAHDAKIMGYHCTRHSDKKVFTEKGILPLSSEIIKIFKDGNQSVKAKGMWEYRSQQTPGPYFLLSYRDAKKPDNHFCTHGPEILLACADYQVNADKAKSIPLIIHCAIPYSILKGKNYFAFCILRSYFNFLDPEGDSTNFFDGYSIDLGGNTLAPQYVIEAEEYEAK